MEIKTFDFGDRVRLTKEASEYYERENDIELEGAELFVLGVTNTKHSVINQALYQVSESPEGSPEYQFYAFDLEGIHE